MGVLAGAVIECEELAWSLACEGVFVDVSDSVESAVELEDGQAGVVDEY